MLGLKEIEHQLYKIRFWHFVGGKQGVAKLMTFANVNACCELLVGWR
jgi:hypothetical protein